MTARPDPTHATADEWLAFGRQVLASQAFSRSLGTQLQALSPGQAELHLQFRDDHRQQHGFAHGGVLSYLSDNALTFAGGTVLGDCVTAEFKINYVRPASGAGTLVAAALVLSAGRSQAVCRCEIFMVRADGSRQLCAAAQGTISALTSRADP